MGHVMLLYKRQEWQNIGFEKKKKSSRIEEAIKLKELKLLLSLLVLLFQLQSHI